MTTTAPARLPSALEPALKRVRFAARTAAERTVESLSLAAMSARSTAQRDTLLNAQFELNRKLAIFTLSFDEALEHQVVKQVWPRTSNPSAPTTWDTMTLVEDHEVEIKVAAERFALDIQNHCEWEIRELDQYMGAILRLGSADKNRNPLRPELIGQAMVRAVEATADRPELRKVLLAEVGRSMAGTMRQTYIDIMTELRAQGVRPTGLSVRGTEGPGLQVGSLNSNVDRLPGADGGGPSPSVLAALGQVSGNSATGDLATQPATLPLGDAPGSGLGRDGRLDSGSSTRGGSLPRGGGTAMGHVDATLMALIRRLAFSTPLDVASAGTTGGSLSGIGSLSGPGGLPASNLIVANRDVLRQATTGALDHMVIDVVGSLFDQILSDPKVPPQMARQIARLQLPVLRAALGDPTFFSSRRHPVRRFVNRIASVGVAFDDLEAEDGRAFLKLVRDLVQEIVEGDFDQIETYEQKLAALELFVVEQSRREVQRDGGKADEVLNKKEDQLRLQQRYATQLRHGLKDLPAPEFLRDFVSSVWSQAVMQAVVSDGIDSPSVARLRLAGRDLLMSVQPKGSPAQRKAFLIGLPVLMKTLNAGMDMIKWPEPARKDFFARLLPAHAESLKGEALTTLDYNLLTRQVDVVLGMPIPKASELPPMPASELPVLLDAVQENTFTEAEARSIGLVDERSIDWDRKIDIELEVEPEVQTADIKIEGLPVPDEPAEPSRGKSLADHVQIGFAYQMHIDGHWHKVRLAHVSAGRTFFVFTRGQKHKRTISMTYRMLSRMCETNRLRAFENAYLIERATARARRQLAELRPAAAARVPASAGASAVMRSGTGQLVRH
ncbi:MAG: DUF1631 family protein [Burkholderiaceae bacterium]